MSAAVMLLVLLCIVQPARATDVDWKIFDGAAGDFPTLCFFDAQGIVRAHNVRVWTKCLLLKDMQAIDLKKDYGGRIWDTAQRKLDEHYVPPLAALEDLSGDGMMRTIEYEQIANISVIQLLVLAYVELDCTERMMRNLDTTVQSGDERQRNPHPSDWQYVGPESGAAALFKLLCR